MAKYAIEVENINKTFRGKKETVQALKDINLRIEKGEIFGLLGPNGAGKTTLLNVITGLLYPDSGRVRVLGEDVRGNRGVLERMNIVFGTGRFHWILKGENILNFYGMVYGIPRPERDRRIAKLVEFFGLERAINRKYIYMSTGERSRLGFAKALLNRPEIILMDEPTLGLDPNIAIKVRNEIKKINKTFGTTILLTSHYMQEIEQLSDRIAFINNGEITDIGTVEKVKLSKFSEYDLIIELKDVVCREELKRLGFRIRGRKLYKTLGNEEDLSRILHKLSKLGCEIRDIETRKPTLEDYFVKIMEAGK